MRASITIARSRRRTAIGAPRSNPGTSISESSSAAASSTRPCRSFMSSATVIGRRSPREMSAVTCVSPSGNTSMFQQLSSINTATSVVPPPISTSTTPSRRCSTVSAACAEASGCRMLNSMPTRALRSAFSRLSIALIVPETTCVSTPRRRPANPAGLATAFMSSIENVFGITATISRSAGKARLAVVWITRSIWCAAIVVSLARSRSSARWLRDFRWPPAIPT